MTRREWALTAVEVAGVVLVAAGVWLIYHPAALIVAGVGALLFALAAQMGGRADAG